MAKELRKRLAKAQSNLNALAAEESDSQKEVGDDDFAVGAKVHVRLNDERGEPTSPDFVPMSKEIVEKLSSNRALDVLKIRHMKKHGLITAAQLKYQRQLEEDKVGIDRNDPEAIIRKYTERQKMEEIRAVNNRSRDRLSRLRKDYPELKNVEVKTAKVFAQYYDRYMSLSGINKKPIWNDKGQGAKNKQLVAQIMREKTKAMEKINDKNSNLLMSD